MSFSWFRLIIFPGLLYALPLGWLMLWVERKATARMQRRIGPPFFQPFYDFIKLLGKRTPRPQGPEGYLLSALPVLAVGSLAGTLALLPVIPQGSGFTGDLVLLVALLELPSICSVLAGFASRSLFGQVGATREAVLSAAYNLPFLMAIVALGASTHTWNLAGLVQTVPWAVRLLAVLAILLCLPAKLRINPFSQPNAEQEIYAGPLTELGGAQLALWELAHGMEWVALTGLVSCLLLPPTGLWALDILLFVACSLLLVVLLAALAAATARVQVNRAAQFYWRWGLAAGILAMAAAVVLAVGG